MAAGSADEGVENAAILLSTIGEEAAAEVFKYLGPKEVQKIGTSMAGLDNLTKERVGSVLTAFREEAVKRAPMGFASGEYVRNVLTKALGEDRAGNLIDRIFHGSDTSGIESLKWMDAGDVAELIRNEHPQIIATILVHLERDQASDILGHFTERLRNDVILRIATLDGIQPSALKELNDALADLLAGSGNLKKSAMGGVRAAAELVNNLASSQEASVISAVRDHDPDLAQKIQDEMFVFENIIEIDDRGIQTLLREVQSDTLITALKGTSDDLKDKIFRNMSSRAAEMLQEDMEAKGPVRLSEVEAEQKEILKIVRRLADEGQIVMAGKGEEMV